MSRADFRATQFGFAGYIRNPDSHPAPADVELRRMKVYRDLFFNNVEDFMSNSYPVLHELLGESRWMTLIKDYFARHQAHTPLFPKMPAEFLDYPDNEYSAAPGDPPFIRELAHYEWVEIELASADDTPDMSRINTNGDLLGGVPAISPLVRMLSCQYPVHRISADFIPGEPSETPVYLLVFRDRKDDVCFLEINALTWSLLQMISDNVAQHTGGQMLASLAEALPQFDPGVVQSGGMEILDDMHKRGILLGTGL
ncbi:MAG: putative DNA-binding domain-containing protein [Gammaproteobacteria bacterium]|nr:putative DNA-binding domain-containing protein [Gammaproteobacteria bacterium]